MEDQDQPQNLEALDRAIAIGLAGVEAGRVKPIDAVFDWLQAKDAALLEARG